jgi:hypothetical protein
MTLILNLRCKAGSGIDVMNKHGAHNGYAFGHGAYINRGGSTTGRGGGDAHLLLGLSVLKTITKLPNSLLNPNQFHAFGIDVSNNPYSLHNKLGMDCGDVFIPFDTKDSQ